MVHRIHNNYRRRLGYAQSSPCLHGDIVKVRSGAVIAARTVEWALGDAHHDTLVIFPRGHAFTAVGATASQDKISRDIASATQITTASDLTNRTLYFHTMDKRQIQKLDLRKIDFGTVEHQLLTQGAVRQQVV